MKYKVGWWDNTETLKRLMCEGKITLLGATPKKSPKFTKKGMLAYMVLQADEPFEKCRPMEDHYWALVNKKCVERPSAASVQHSTLGAFACALTGQWEDYRECIRIERESLSGARVEWIIESLKTWIKESEWDNLIVPDATE